MRERRRVAGLFVLALVALLATACGTNTAVKTSGASPHRLDTATRAADLDGGDLSAWI
jgi:hypothetical protein